MFCWCIYHVAQHAMKFILCIFSYSTKQYRISISYRKYRGKNIDIDIDCRIPISPITSVRHKLYHSRKHLKEKSTKDIGLGRLSDNRIYIAESLTKKNKVLFNKCLEVKKSFNYKFIWTSQGNIYLKRDTKLTQKVNLYSK